MFAMNLIFDSHCCDRDSILDLEPQDEQKLVAKHSRESQQHEPRHVACFWHPHALCEPCHQQQDRKGQRVSQEREDERVNTALR